jgi:hypothetical protein
MSGVNGSTVTVLIVQCASFLHIVIGIIYPHALGRGYSNVRYALIYTWIAVCAATVLMNGVRPQVKALVNIVGTLLLLDWFFILITSSVA